MSYRLHPAAQDEFSAAAAYYVEHASRFVAAAFIKEFERVMLLLELNQQLGTLVAGDDDQLARERPLVASVRERLSDALPASAFHCCKPKRLNSGSGRRPVHLHEISDLLDDLGPRVLSGAEAGARSEQWADLDQLLEGHFIHDRDESVAA